LSTGDGRWPPCQTKVERRADNLRPVGARSGEFGGFVGWWQVSLNRWLQRHHHREIVVDCSFGPQTAAATRAFQNALHLAASGTVDQETWSAAVRLGLTHLP
jgi:peptidoglycan hydrolase-like protein with peptidoglycan-binding domain